MKELNVQIAFLKSNFDDFNKFVAYWGQKNQISTKKGLEYIQSHKKECFFCLSTENLEFLHKNPLNKKYTISQMTRMSPKTIQGELNKCWCVCKTCKKKISKRLMDPLPDFWQ
jgi:hypothetical protein